MITSKNQAFKEEKNRLTKGFIEKTEECLNRSREKGITGSEMMEALIFASVKAVVALFIAQCFRLTKNEQNKYASSVLATVGAMTIAELGAALEKLDEENDQHGPKQH